MDKLQANPIRAAYTIGFAGLFAGLFVCWFFWLIRTRVIRTKSKGHGDLSVDEVVIQTTDTATGS